MIRGLLDRLDPRAQLAVARRFGLIDGESHGYREVGEELGVTAEAARRLVKRAVDDCAKLSSSSHNGLNTIDKILAALRPSTCTLNIVNTTWHPTPGPITPLASNRMA